FLPRIYADEHGQGKGGLEWGGPRAVLSMPATWRPAGRNKVLFPAEGTRDPGGQEIAGGVTVCHPERSEGSAFLLPRQIPRCARDDGPLMTAIPGCGGRLSRTGNRSSRLAGEPENRAPRVFVRRDVADSREPKDGAMPLHPCSIRVHPRKSVAGTRPQDRPSSASTLRTAGSVSIAAEKRARLFSPDRSTPCAFAQRVTTYRYGSAIERLPAIQSLPASCASARLNRPRSDSRAAALLLPIMASSSR